MSSCTFSPQAWTRFEVTSTLLDDCQQVQNGPITCVERDESETLGNLALEMVWVLEARDRNARLLDHEGQLWEGVRVLPNEIDDTLCSSGSELCWTLSRTRFANANSIGCARRWNDVLILSESGGAFSGFWIESETNNAECSDAYARQRRHRVELNPIENELDAIDFARSTQMEVTDAS